MNRNHNMKTSKQSSLYKLTFIFIIISLLSSCSGGGNEGATTSPPPVDTSSSDWDSMVWDQDDWG